jgi:hypothetical protein
VGFSSREITPHGFRATASSSLLAANRRFREPRTLAMGQTRQ